MTSIPNSTGPHAEQPPARIYVTSEAVLGGHQFTMLLRLEQLLTDKHVRDLENMLTLAASRFLSTRGL